MSGDLLTTRVHVEQAMGTVVSLHASAPSRVAIDGALRAAVARMHALIGELTVFEPDSPMSLVRTGKLAVADAPSSVGDVLRESAVVRDLTAGWFDPWSLPGGVDPTGLAKGWILEAVTRVLAEHGVTSAVVNGGGDIRTLGEPPYGAPWRIAVQHPWRRDAFACVLAVTGAIATSGAYERGAHLFDPRRGTLTEAAASATVVGPNLAVADGLATALAVGADEVLTMIESMSDYDGYLIRTDGTESQSSGIAVVDAVL